MLGPLFTVVASVLQQLSGQSAPPHAPHGAEPLDPPSPAPLAYREQTGGFAAPGLDGGDTEIEFADVDGDGHLDLLSIGDHGSPLIGTPQHGVMVWFGNGGGGWSLFQNGNFGYGGIAVGDVDNDGHADVAYGMHHDYSSNDFGDQLIEVALGDGTGLSWTPWDDGLASNGETYGMFATDLADVDNDGWLDVLSNSFGCCAGAHVYESHGDGSWTQSFGFLGGNATASAVFGDFDADGNADCAVGNAMGNVWRGNGAGGFAAADAGLPGSASSRQGFDFGDVDEDGTHEYAFQSGGDLRVCKWVGAGWVDLSNGLPRNSPLDMVQLIDMDFDGHLDLVGFGGGLVGIFLGDGAGNWSFESGFSVGTSGTAVVLRAGDADHNGRPDLALIQDESCGIVCSENTPYFFIEKNPAIVAGVRLYSPRGGETWVEGAVRAIEWQAAIPPGAPSSATLALSTDSGPWQTLAADVPNDGHYQLVVPAGSATASARLRITVAVGPSSTSRTSAPFRILPAGGD